MASRQNLLQLHNPEAILQQNQELDNFKVEFGAAWADTTTFAQWQYRMSARQILQPLFFALLNGLDASASGRFVESVKMQPLPTPLSWHGQTEYLHDLYSPQSEAGLWNAYGLSYIAEWDVDWCSAHQISQTRCCWAVRAHFQTFQVR